MSMRVRSHGRLAAAADDAAAASPAADVASRRSCRLTAAQARYAVSFVFEGVTGFDVLLQSECVGRCPRRSGRTFFFMGKVNRLQSSAGCTYPPLPPGSSCASPPHGGCIGRLPFLVSSTA